jgi:hypothetical protein
VAWVFSIGGSNVWMTNTLVDAKSDDGFPFNTGMSDRLLPLKAIPLFNMSVFIAILSHVISNRTTHHILQTALTSPPATP